jgi:hypothetical protein
MKSSRSAVAMNSAARSGQVTDFEVYDFYFSGIEKVFSGYNTTIIMLFMPNLNSDELPDRALIEAVAAHPGIIPVNGLHAIQLYDVSVRDYMRKHPQPPAHMAYARLLANTIRSH